MKRDMVFLNGELLPLEEAKVPVLDRGFIFGDGVYELVPVYSRVAFRLDEHLARLERSLGEAKIRNPYSRAQWREHIHAVVDAQPFEDQGVYFQVTRGVAKRDHAFPRNVEPTVFMMANPLVNPPQAQVERGGVLHEPHAGRVRELLGEQRLHERYQPAQEVGQDRQPELCEEQRQ